MQAIKPMGGKYMVSEHVAYKLTASYEKERKTNQQAPHMHYNSKVWGQMH